jgi:hypothetical protein
MIFTFEAKVWKWSGQKSSWHFATLPSKFCSDIKNSCQSGKGFGSVRVVAKIGQMNGRHLFF